MAMKEKTIESRVASAILQNADCVVVNGTEYKVEQPTLATLAMLSELVSTLPDYDMDGKVLDNVLASARTSAPTVARIAALLILGAARIRKSVTVKESGKHKWCRFLPGGKRISEYDRLTRDLEEGVTPSEINAIITKRFCDMQVGDFFAVTASLKGQSILAPTREAEETASGG